MACYILLYESKRSRKLTFLLPTSAVVRQIPGKLLSQCLATKNIFKSASRLFRFTPRKRQQNSIIIFSYAMFPLTPSVCFLLRLFNFEVHTKSCRKRGPRRSSCWRDEVTATLQSNTVQKLSRWAGRKRTLIGKGWGPVPLLWQQQQPATLAMYAVGPWIPLKCIKVFL